MTNAPHLTTGAGRAPASRSLAPALFACVAVTFAVLVTPAKGADSGAISPDDSLIGSVKAPTRPETLPALPSAVRPGESLRFAVNYGFINAGAAYLEVSEPKNFKGRGVLHLVARAESNRFFSGIYKVRNRIESTWDTAGHYSLRYTESRREGKHRATNEILFDYANQEARYQDGQTFPIPPEVQDALSSFYYARTQALPLGGSVYFDYHASRKSVPLEVKVLGREQVETPAGKFRCVVIEPVLKAGGIFKNKGRLVIWLTDDNRRMPVLMKSKVAVGSISATLVEVKPGV